MRSAILFLGFVALIGCGGEIDEPVQSVDPTTGQSTEAVTTYNGYCEVFKFGPRYQYNGRCYATAPMCVRSSDGGGVATCAGTIPNPFTPTSVCAGPLGSYKVNINKPCSFSQ